MVAMVMPSEIRLGGAQCQRSWLGADDSGLSPRSSCQRLGTTHHDPSVRLWCNQLLPVRALQS